jgi:hypothetical protein
MEKEEFLTELKKVLIGFNFYDEMNVSKCINADKEVPKNEYRDENKATVRVDGVRSIFISSEMGTEEKHFFYMTVKTLAQIDKVFISGATYEIMLERITKQVNEING